MNRDNTKLENHRMLLTGATGGIGREIAKELNARGCALLLAGRNEEKLDKLRAELAGPHAMVNTVAANLATDEGRRAVVIAATRFRRGITGIINNAGVNCFGAFANLSAQQLRSIVETNVLAPLLLTHDLLPVMQRSSASVVLNVGSILGSIGMPGQVAYSSSKFALHGFSEALRRELRGSGVRVLHVAPRATDTEMNGASQRAINEATGVRTDRPEAVAREVVAALESLREERFLGWPEKFFVRFNALLPRVVDRSLQKQADLVGRGERNAGLTSLNGVKP